MEERGGMPVDLRTLQRDFNAIEEMFGIRICFDKKRNGYYINEEDGTKKEQYERLLLNFDILNALDTSSGLHTYVIAEHHRPVNNEYLPLLIKAIKFSHPITFKYMYAVSYTHLDVYKRQLYRQYSCHRQFSGRY